MPELPEVQTIVNQLNQEKIIDSTITKVQIGWLKSVHPLPIHQFSTAITDAQIKKIWRYGKYIILTLSTCTHLLIHLRMSGRLYVQTHHKPVLKHEHLILSLSSQKDLRLHDTRKFARVQLVTDPNPTIDRLGPDALETDYRSDDLYRLLKKSHRKIKTFLLDQSKIAGLGNIYVDEVLWYCGIHPCQETHVLSIQDAKRIKITIKKVLKSAIHHKGTSLGSGKGNYQPAVGQTGEYQNYLKVFRKTNQPCPKCHSIIQKIKVSQRSTHLCPLCQPLKNI